MAHIGIHRVEDIARRRLARIAQIEAMPPAVPRHAGDHWDFNRIGWAQPFVPIRQARKFAERESAGDAGVQLLAPEPAAAAICPRSRSYVLWFEDTNFIGPKMIAVSSPVVPFPFFIEAVNYDHRNGGLLDPTMNVVVGDGVYDQTSLEGLPSGSAHWERPNTVAASYEVSQPGIGPLANTTSTKAFPLARSRSGPYPAGMRLIAVVRSETTGLIQYTANMIIQVTECVNSGPEFYFDYLPPAPEFQPPTVEATTEEPPPEEPSRFWRLG